MYKINKSFRNNVLLGGRFNYRSRNAVDYAAKERWGSVSDLPETDWEGELSLAAGFLSLGCTVFLIVAIVKLILFQEAAKKEDKEETRKNSDYGVYFGLWGGFCCFLMMTCWAMPDNSTD